MKKLRRQIAIACAVLMCSASAASASTVWGDAWKVSAGCFQPDSAQTITVKRTSTQATVATPTPDENGRYWWENCTSDHYDTTLVDSWGNTFTKTNEWEYGECP